MVGLVLLMRYSRTRHTGDGELYLASTAVFMMEVMKFCLCLGVVFYQGNCSVTALRSELYKHVWASPYDLIKLCVPSFLYTIQNNLLYLALTNLDAASYQVLYQLKILTTAIFSATMLGRRFSATKWASLVVLTCGGSEVTLWIRNIQMGLFSIAIALAVGGLIVAVVVKYADNVLKVFASSFSILLSCLISALAFDFRPNRSFLVGASLVLLSTVMYSKPSKRPPRDVLPLVQHGTPGKKACFVHVGKTAGSTVGCSLGFNLHCTSKVQAPGVLPHYTTNMFHAQMYDCDDETTTFFIFVVRHPLDRWISAFNYDNPSRDWEGFRQQFGEKHFKFRSQLYAECPFNTINDVGEALSAESNVTNVCKRRAEASIDGTEHFGCHHYFNYQFHLEAIPQNATIMTLRTEHLIEDWNSVEYNLGGGKEVLGQGNNIIAHNNVNKASDGKLKYLSEQSQRKVCEKLCNEIQTYKKILQLSINLSEKQVQESVDEVMNSCPIEALATTCNDPIPNITDKLIYSRGYMA
ncbi:nucleotide-sugar transporter [Skeletonema marinoi]|uniref:Nucleotide-sugar transporter n=1 Tax=Skeletonema marinoi TaxID=267567 RepID=A0AAD9DIG3_9STRA|nr:nucleotide-sugar transporter [Skeletonema marinoi]